MMTDKELNIFEKCLLPCSYYYDTQDIPHYGGEYNTINSFNIYNNFEGWLINNDEIPLGAESNREFIDEIKKYRLHEISEMVFNNNMKWIYFSKGKLEGIPEHGEQLSIGPYHIYFDKKKWRELRINSLI